MILIFFLACYLVNATALKVGVGKADITGIIGEIDNFGYAKLNQAANGIHLRLYSRAFIYGENEKRVVYVSCNLGAISNFVKQRVIKILNNSLYSEENVMISAEHTHSGPSGYLDNFLYTANVFGVVKEQREAIAAGIVSSIIQAHKNFESSIAQTLHIHSGEIDHASINRSPSSYLENPTVERALYNGDVDKTMTILAARDQNGGLKSFISWFPVHGTSMNETYKLVSGDNKGYAAHVWETQSEPGFVSAFSISNAGDVSPNVNGPRCSDTGAPCDGGKTSCPDAKGNYKISKCIAFGPGLNNDNFENTKIIGTRQALGARNILQTPGLLLLDSTVEYRHLWVDMSNVLVTTKNGTKVKTCAPAMGQSFSAGTTDGPGVDGSYQGVGKGNQGLGFLSEILGHILSPGENLPEATKELKDCHAPKTVLLATGEYKIPYPWQPKIVPLQIFVIARKFIIIGQPSEITTMAGRRLRRAVLSRMITDGTVDSDAHIVIAGLSNTYSSYLTTYEEYQAQRYEAGSTIFGPNSLQAYIESFTFLASSFSNLNTTKLHNAIAPKEGDYEELSLNNQLVHKLVSDSGNYGKIIKDISSFKVKVGDVVSARFQCAHPRSHGYNNRFMSVERLENNEWIHVLNDGEWDTKFMWYRIGGNLSAKSECEISWSVGETIKVNPGMYRLRLFGTAQNLFGKKRRFEGSSSSFTVS